MSKFFLLLIVGIVILVPALMALDCSPARREWLLMRLKEVDRQSPERDDLEKEIVDCIRRRSDPSRRQR